MNKNKIEYLVETDILLDHLKNHSNSLSVLEKAMSSGICFTTVINSSELIYSVNSKNEKDILLSLLNALKVLGLHSRYSLYVDEYIGKVLSVRDAIICTVAKLNKLLILTDDTKKFENSGIKVLTSKDL
ncbi:PIN domain protein [bacterium BMS3Abin04]|nr:PIN domain protein [bacterium BMS3Abin04]